ncbi:MAG: hypothetical protein AB8H80_21180 [Planctomycetota bacterium]
MKLAAQNLILALLLLAPACSSTGGGLSMPNINDLLASITDTESAEAAKAPLEGAVKQLDKAIMGAKEKTEGAASEGGSMVDKVLSGFGINSDTMGMISGLMGNGGIASVLGGTLGKLKDLIPMGL